MGAVTEGCYFACAAHLICTEDVPSSYCISLFVLKIVVPDLYCTSLLVLGGGTKAQQNPS